MNFYQSIITSGYNPYGVLFTFIIWFLMLLSASPLHTFVSPIRNNSTSRVGLCLFLFIIVSVLGLHRWDTYHILSSEHLEPIHKWLLFDFAENVSLVYRFIVFGGTVCIYYYIAKRLNVYSRNFCLVCVILLVDSMFCEMRGSIGYTLLLFGVVLLGDNRYSKFKIVRKTIGVICIIASLFFHRSVFIYAIIALISLIRFDKKGLIIISWIAYPFLITIAIKYFSYILSIASSLDFGSMRILESVAIYGEGEFSFGQFNLVGRITRFITKSASYLVFIYLTYKLCFKSIKLEPIYHYLFRWYYICVYVGSILSSMDINSWLGVRISVMSLYSVPFVLAKIWQNETKATMWTKMIIVCGFVGNILSFFIRYRDWHNLI